MKFKNLKTGNTLVTENETTIALMKKSEQYEEVVDKVKEESKVEEEPKNSKK